MKNNKKKTRITKIEKRRLAFEKRNVKKEQNLARYGAEGGSALVMAKTTEFNRRIIAAILALVFVLTTIVVGYNFAAKADDPDGGFKMFESIDDSGFVTRKGIKLDDKGTTDTTDDTYDLRMEAYATKNLAQKTLDDKTPLDIVMVLQEGTSMAEQDVLQGYNASSATSFSINDAKTKYYLDDGVYYPLQVDRVYAPVLDNEGERTIWTAQEAFDWSVDNSKLYYLNGNTYQEVKYLKDVTYINRNDNKIYTRDLHHTVWGPHNYTTSQYINVPVNGKTDWHELKYNETGRSVTGFGYFYTFYYYTNVVTSSANYEVPSSARAGATAGSGNSQVSFLNDYESIVYRAAGIQENTYYEHTAGNGNLYTQGSVSQKYNYLYTDSYVLASQAPDSQDSEDYEGLLYYYGYQLFYTKDGQKHYVGSPTVRETDVAISDGTLYEEDIITRQAALKSAANQFAEQIAEDAATSNIDHRIAVIGYATNGDIKSGLVSAKEDDSDDENHVNDAVDSAINGLGSSGGNNITAGLNSAKAAFDASTIDSSNRKRIVVVFADASVSSSSDALAEANSLKDTYNASVYTVGLNNNNEDFLRKVSSEYFYTQQTNNGTYYYRAKDAYSDTTGVPVSGIEPLADAFSAVFGALKPASITTTLDATNAMLKDVISANFNTENITSTTVQTAESQYSDGVLSWETAQNAGLEPNWGPDGKTLTVEGFDYSANYVNYETENHPGKKIIVTITGLKLNEKVKTGADKRIYSNEENSGIYKKDVQDDIVMGAFPMPYVDNKTQMAPAGSSGVPDAGSGIVVNKYLSPNANGNYDLTVEAYTTETSVTKTEKIPTDFIVVADQSGSMAYKDMATTYTDAGATYLETIAEDAAKGETEGYPDGYYYHDASTDNYYRVYPVRSYLYEYIPAETKWTQNIIEDAGMDLSWFQREEEATYSKANQYYYKTSDNVYRPVKVTATGKIGTYYIEFSYKDANGATVDFVRPSKPVYKNVFGSDTSKYGPGSFGYGAVNAAVLTAYPRTTAYTYSEFLGVTTGMYINYPMYKRHVGYTELRYRDVNGVEHTVPASNGNSTWEYCNSSGQAKTTASGSTRPTYTNLYKGTGKITRLQALKNALTSFATAVANEKDDFNQPVDNRIAIVGFSSEKSDTSYTNTELLTGENLTISNNNGVQMRLAGTEDYKTALVSATQSGEFGRVNDKINDAIAALTARGGTQPEDGLEMAYEILRNRDITTYATESSGKTEKVDRNVFVIFFTDGHPGDYEYSDMYSEANDVVEKAKLIKDYRVGDSDVSVDNQVVPSLFSIGVFGESDGNPLTYHAHTYSTAKNYDYLFESGHMDIYNAGWSGYYYLNRNWIASDTSEYGSTANDTIFDYMSVVSSNYPNATKYMQVVNTGSHPGAADKTGYATYSEMVNGVRSSSTASNTNKFYRMASNQATLVAAFEQAVTRATQSISANARLDANAVMRDVFKNTNFVTSGNDTTYNFASVVGSMDRNGVVNFKEESKQILYLPYEVETDENTNNTYIDVTGFDYLANYINNKTTNQDGTITDTPHDGKKLVTTITNVVPTGETGDNLESNMPNSAMYFSGNTLAGKPFPTPAITSYKYTLDVGDVNKNAVFNVTATVWNPNAEEGEEAVDKDSEMLEDVIIVYPNGERHLYREVGAQTFYGMKNGQAFYFENLPSSYQIRTDVSSTDDAYNYSIYYDNDGTSKTPMEKGVVYTNPFSYDNHTINISSTRNDKPISIRETTVGTYADMSLEFGEVITLEIPVVEGEDQTGPFEYDCTFDKYHNFSDETIPAGATYQAVFSKERETDGTIYAKLTGFKWAKGGNTGTWTLTTDGFPMQTGDEITITVKGGDTVKVNEVVTHDYGVTYYSGQDDVDPNDIKLKGLDGSLLTGQYELTLIPVDGTEGDKKTLTFNNGILQDETDPIDLALYQSISSATDLSEATLDISGETFNFDYETDGEKEAYVATIRDITDEPPASATVEKNKMDILIVNRMGEIPIESVYDNGHSHIIIYILSGAGILALAAGGYYVWKKKDEFVEQ